MNKLIAAALSGLLCLAFAGATPGLMPGGPDDPPPPPKKGEPKKRKDEAKEKEEPKKKAEAGPAGELRRAYDLLRRIKADDGPSGRSDDRLRDWTDRAAGLYRKGVAAHAAGEPRQAHEYAIAAHDLARAVDHARNASRFDRPDADLPPPPDAPGPGGDGGMARRDLRRAYDRIVELDGEGEGDAGARFYLDAARDLYNAARRDAQGDRAERAGELARAAEAITHVPEHLARADRDDPEPKAKKGPRPPEPKVKKAEPPADDDLPPSLPPRD